MVEVKVVEGSNDFVILKSSLDEKLGSDWRNKYTFMDVRRVNGNELDCELTKDKLTIGEYSFKLNNDLNTTPKMIMTKKSLSNDKGEIQEHKKRLKSLGATYFRVVKTRYGSAIICFKANKMLNLIK